MPARTVVLSLVLGFIFPALSSGQQKAEGNAAPRIQEFPVVLQHDVVAGKTAVGTKVSAKLAIATLVGKTVVPKSALFSGEVVESVAKTATAPSRLMIRADSVQWKNDSLPIRAYLVSWYYPTVAASGQDLQYGPQQSAAATWNGEGEYPDPNSKVYRPFPDSNSDKKSSVPVTPNSMTSSRRVPLGNVDLQVLKNGALALISAHSNIKLDRITTYVLLSGDLSPAR
jgi:hypothetical protein